MRISRSLVALSIRKFDLVLPVGSFVTWAYSSPSSKRSP